MQRLLEPLILSLTPAPMRLSLNLIHFLNQSLDLGLGLGLGAWAQERMEKRLAKRREFHTVKRFWWIL